MSGTPAPSFGELLRHYRLAKGLTQETLAERAKISSRAVSDLERGLRDRPRPETIQLLADALGLTPPERAAFRAVVRRSRRPVDPRGPLPPPGTMASGNGVPHHNLPLYLSTFIGREKEVMDLRGLLQTSRLVTLTGPGGGGKTRLAMHLSGELIGTYPDGVWLVDLAPLADPTRLPYRVGAILGLREQPDRSMETILTTHLRAQRTLLIFDNCEHLVDASARLAELLLSAGSALGILVTSRSALGIPGEVRYVVPPLPWPSTSAATSTDDLRRFAAVELFVERARSVRPGFTLTARNAPTVVEICRHVDGLPLAIELAAAWVRVLTVEQIAARFDDRFRLLTGTSRTESRRGSSLRSTLDESYRLLSEAERALLRRLAVFAGGWTLEAAEAVCADETGAPAGVLERLTSLVDQSLVVVEEQGEQARYRFLETIRQYAYEELREAGEEAPTRDRHVDWYLALAERSLPELTRHDQFRWYGRLHAESDNLRAALDWSGTNEAAADIELRLAGALGRYWCLCHFLDEGRDRLRHALARADRQPTPALSLALNYAGQIASTQGDYLQAKPLAEEAVAVARATGDASLLSLALRHLAGTERALGLDPLADEHLETALAEARRAGDRREIGWNLGMLGRGAVQKGDLGLGRQQLELALQELQESGDRPGIAMARTGLSLLEAEEGNLERARALAEPPTATSVELELRFGWTDMLAGDTVQAILALESGDFLAAGAHVRDALHFAKEFGDHEAMVAGLFVYARLQGKMGNLTGAARMFGAARAQGATSRPVRHLVGPHQHEKGLAATRAALGPEAFEAAWADGQRMTRDQAVDEALQRLSCCIQN